MEKCRKVRIRSPKAAERYVFRKLSSNNNYERFHSVWCDGEMKASPNNDPTFMVTEIKKRPGCVYRVEQQREAMAHAEPTRQVMALHYSGTERVWKLERKVFTPSKSWLD